MTRYPFRQMRETTKTVRIQCGLLLAVDGLEFTKEDYSLFFVMSSMLDNLKNPTYKQAYGAMGGLMSLYRRLIDKLEEESDLRKQCDQEWFKLVSSYPDIVAKVVG